MSLQVWLPFTDGTLKQQGLSSAAATNGGTVNLTNVGKLGRCATLGTAAGGITLPASTMTSFTKCSVAFWVKIISWNTSYATLFQAGLGSTPWNNYIFGILRNNTNSNLCFTLTNSSSSSTSASYVSSNLEVGEWYHLAFVYNTGVCKIYINGVEDKSYNTSYVPNFAGITHISIGRSTNGSNYQTNCSLNDFRIYDHALSPMEVKWLSQGLVLHYPLNREGFGVDNILLNTHFDSRYTQSTGWDTTKNGTQLANSWGGYNSGVTNQATVYHAHLKEFNGEWVYEYIKTANESWLGISQRGLQSKLTTGKTYTFSWEEYHVEGTNRVGTGLYYYKTGATSANFHLGIQQATEVTREIGKWQKYTYTFTAPSDADWSKNMSWYVYGHYNGNGTFYIRHIKLEEGSIATPWCPNSSDALATSMGLNGTAEYDISGFCNNGTRTGTFSWTSDTPKYAVSTHIGSTSQKIFISNFPTSGFGNSYSFAWWGKRTSNNPMFWGFSNGIRLNGMYAGTLWNTGDSSNNPIYKPGTTTTITAPSINIWHHYVMTGDGTTCKLYLDGELYGQAKTYKAISGTAMYINGWNSSTTYCSDNTDMSDFRIYATALSAEDVKSLYQNCATIDPDGTIRGQIRS